MTPEIKAILEQLIHELDETRRTVCVDGDASYQHGFFNGFELAQSLGHINLACRRLNSRASA